MAENWNLNASPIIALASIGGEAWLGSLADQIVVSRASILTNSNNRRRIQMSLTGEECLSPFPRDWHFFFAPGNPALFALARD